jgi:hypothetical protein
MITIQETRKNILYSSVTYRDDVANVLNTVFENTVLLVNKCLETGGGHFEQSL